MGVTTVQESPAPYGRTMLAKSQGESRVLLHGITWSTYKLLSKELGDSRSCRLAFDSGELEIMSPLVPHERSHFSISQMVVILAEECGIEYIALGSLTCEREDLKKAIEPDGCFYVRNFQKVKGLEDINLDIHPPPDIMIEVDISSNSMNKLPICAALGVPEHWRFDGKKLEIRVLRNGRYFESAESLAFAGIPFAQKVPEFIEMSRSGCVAASREFRKWVRAQLKSKKPARRSKKS